MDLTLAKDAMERADGKEEAQTTPVVDTGTKEGDNTLKDDGKGANSSSSKGEDLKVDTKESDVESKVEKKEPGAEVRSGLDESAKEPPENQELSREQVWELLRHPPAEDLPEEAPAEELPEEVVELLVSDDDDSWGLWKSSGPLQKKARPTEPPKAAKLQPTPKPVVAKVQAAAEPPPLPAPRHPPPKGASVPRSLWWRQGPRGSPAVVDGVPHPIGPPPARVPVDAGQDGNGDEEEEEGEEEEEEEDVPFTVSAGTGGRASAVPAAPWAQPLPPPPPPPPPAVQPQQHPFPPQPPLVPMVVPPSPPPPPKVVLAPWAFRGVRPPRPRTDAWGGIYPSSGGYVDSSGHWWPPLGLQ